MCVYKQQLTNPTHYAFNIISFTTLTYTSFIAGELDILYVYSCYCVHPPYDCQWM